MRENNRMLVELERMVREVNRATIQPTIPDLTLDRLGPVLRMVAEVRAKFLEALFELAEATPEHQLPEPGRIKELRNLRLTYEELVAATQAMETAIQRGYLDIGQPAATQQQAAGA